MAGRVLFQRGANFKFRISKPGKDVDSTDLFDFVLHEGIGTVAPNVTGSVQVPANSNVLIPFGRTYQQPALIMLKPSDGVVAFLSQFEARIQSDMASMRIYNKTGTTRYVTYYVYWNSIGG
ncbi:hypothetical protein [Pseudochrobactrum sp. B5]|uniref:hypothetical protein n=1 Tax=Pseudochrobactrum sp. B5 TaxID=1289478 RepID=UPI0009516CA9|nr:hypothetical protein [Pseudochrobactrum sp. B5]